jgi:hypothetical protein
MPQCVAKVLKKLQVKNSRLAEFLQLFTCKLMFEQILFELSLVNHYFYCPNSHQHGTKEIKKG